MDQSKNDAQLPEINLGENIGEDLLDLISGGAKAAEVEWFIEGGFGRRF